ncbi:hypothetical protein HC031_14545 [Planosporangium thailandense]|uniref:Lipoprotein n=1 Tax=Planosporangium thailandense TaxID=765197 RepID=A0ABX0Y0G3_9ACTN|nr:hypothetical protein [Planosporangium thailandense]NJC70925.1 hypothetical protein [Planosporangium thailandense]
MRRFLSTVIAVVTLCAALSGCGWVRAGNRSPNKPTAFVLRGYASVAGAPAGQPGAACEVPASGIGPNAPVHVADPPGHALATGTLRDGVLATDGTGYRCNFAFEIYGVPGGHTTYEISVNDRPPVSFPAEELRQDKPAVIPIP